MNWRITKAQPDKRNIALSQKIRECYLWVSGLIPFGEEIEAVDEEEAEEIFRQDILMNQEVGDDVFEVCVEILEEDE